MTILINVINKFLSEYRVANHEDEVQKANVLIQKHPYEIKLLQAIGILFAQNKKIEDASLIFKKILNIDPLHIDTLINMGIACYELNKLDQAIKYFEKLKNLNIRQDEVYFNLGLIYEKNKNLIKAVTQYKQSIKYNPNNLNSLVNLGNIYLQNQEHDNAKMIFEKTISLKPNDPDLYHNLGIVFTRLSNFEKAIELYSKAQQLKSINPFTSYNLGYLFAKKSKFNESIIQYNKAIKIDPNNAKFYYNLAVSKTELGEYSSAVVNYKKALGISSDYTSARYNLARLNLATENFSEGWRDFEIRHQKDSVPMRVKNILRLNQWNGKPFDGTLFVHGEQGVGDLIIHSSIISDLHKIQPDICLTVDERMLSLFQRSFKDIDVHGYSAHLDYKDMNYKDNDRHIPLASLGSFLRQSINDFPKQPEAYIVPDPERVEHFKSSLSQNKKIKIGLSWCTIGDRDFERNIPLSQMAKFLTIPDVEFINLQYGDTAEERERFKADHGIEMLNMDGLDLMNDFEGLAALIESCDLIITISNITAHIAGAIGKKTIVVVPVYTQWHWFHERNNSLWYPDVQLFRQQQYGQWEDVLDKIHNKVSNLKNN